MKVGTRNGKLINVADPNIKNIVNDLSVDQNVDSHPESTEESRLAANSLKFRLDLVQFRAFELKTFSSLLRVYKELKRTKVILAISRLNFFFRIVHSRAMMQP